MNLSDEGYRLIRSFEGYHTRLKDGSCTAYLCPAGVATIGFGCTEGIKLGMVWTAEEAEAALHREIAKFEAAVSRLVTVSINQNEFDAMVSLAYNIGIGGGRNPKTGKIIPGFKTSTVLKRLNKGDRVGASKAFELWDKGGGRVLPGLVSRRKREAALFLKPIEAPEEPIMPQAVSESRVPLPAPVVAAGACAATTTALPFIPVPPVEMVSNVAGWQTSAETLAAFAGSPVMKYAICGMLIYALFGHVWPWIARKFA